MNNEQLQQTIAVTKQQHQQWLEHSTTKDMIVVLKKQEENIVNVMERFGVLLSDTGEANHSKESLLQLATQLRTIRATTKLLTNSETFTTKLYPVIITQ